MYSSLKIVLFLISFLLGSLTQVQTENRLSYLQRGINFSMLENHYKSLPIQNVLKVPSYGFEEIKGFSEKVYLGDTIAFKVFELEDDNLSINEILKKSEEFKPASYFTGKTNPKNIYWIKLDFKNLLENTDENASVFLKLNTFDYGKVYFLKNEVIHKKPIGIFDFNNKSRKLNISKYFSELSFKPSELISNRYLFLEVRRVRFLEHISNWSFVLNNEPVEKNFSIKYLIDSMPKYIFIGIGSIMSLLMLVFFVYFKRAEFFLYSIYVLSFLVYINKDEYLFLKYLSIENDLTISWYLENVQYVIGLSYMLFMAFYLNLKRDYPFLYRVIKVIIIVHIIMILVDFIFYLFNFHIGHIYMLEVLQTLAMITALITIPYLIFFNKNRITTLFIIGSLSFAIGFIIFNNLNKTIDPLQLYHKNYMIVGVTIEIIVFAMGLAHKVFNEHLDRLTYQREAFINKNKALRAQINPHFIFNSLSSIQHLITLNDKTASLRYLSKFSRLTRNILESSIETNAMLNEEIKMIEDYLELESLRFDNAFSYKINIDENLDLNTIEIPFMILQPFVENAIIHGLLPKKNGPKQLIINFKEENGFVVCEIDDNGVGRRHVKKEKRSYQKEKKSRGLEITKQRLASLNKHQDAIKISDKYIDGKSSGTKVTIKIPL